MTRPRAGLLPALLLAVGANACSASPTFDGGVPLTGVWGGRGVAMNLGFSGGTVEYDCAHGGLLSPLLPDASGAVRGTGIHIREHGGPIRDGEKIDSLPAVYFGAVTGGTLVFRVLVGPDTLGPFSARQGSAAQLFKCL